MGMAVVGTSLLGVTGILLLTGDAPLFWIRFGASSLALFAKAGENIYKQPT